MTCCPHCKARGAKLHDDIGPDYCGRCGKNWPAALSDTIAADGVPPPPDVPHLRLVERPAPRGEARFFERVGALGDRFLTGERFAEQQAGDRLTAEEELATLWAEP